MAFSQSLLLGNSTLANISKEEKALLNDSQRNSEKALEVIDESPTNKTVSKTGKYRGKLTQTQSRSQTLLRKTKSENQIKENLSKDNLSKFFESDFNCEDYTSSSKRKNSRRSSFEDASVPKILKISEDNINDLFDDSGGFSKIAFFDGEQEKETNPTSTRESGDKLQKPPAVEDEWGTNAAFEEFGFEEKCGENDHDSFVDIEDISFACRMREEDDLLAKREFVKKELEITKHEVSVLLNREENVTNNADSLFGKSNLPEPKFSSANISKQSCDLENFSTCDKTMLNWSSSTTNESPVANKNKSKIKYQNRVSSSFQSIQASKSISTWGLPPAILKEYERKGIQNMFDWQVECLSNPKVIFEHQNLVYSAPTSAGKTLVSEILMLKTVLERNKKALLILPFISVVREKMFYLQDLLTSSGYRVEGFFGGYSPPGGFDSINIAVCTIEKANSIVNKLLEQGKLDCIGTVVIDEVHLISDAGRGYILELLLAKMLYISAKFSIKIQIISMSATLANSKMLSQWLNAEMFVTNFRPVELREMIKIGTKVYDNELNFIREIVPSTYNISNDEDHIAYLCIETILEECSVVVFCPSKDWCEKLCLNLASSMYNMIKSSTEQGDYLRKAINRSALGEIKSELKNSPIGLDSVLEKTISFACAFHHAGLTTEERDIIESSFKSGILRILVATSTLSSGVNLPARRVIIRSPMFGGKPMNALTYKQMIGRAGRTGKDTLGESILICNEKNAKTGKDLLRTDLKPIVSCLDLDSSTHLKRAILEVIASNVANTKSDLENFINCTLLQVQRKLKAENEELDSVSFNSDDDPIFESIKFLLEYEFIRLQDNEKTNETHYIATRLGMACLASSMPPNDGLILFSELQKSRRCFVLDSELHAVYLVTPYSVCYQVQEIDWLEYLDIWEKLSPAMKKVGELVGVKESFLVRAMRGQKLDYKLLQIHKRFYTALALQELVNEVPINQVSTKFKCSRGLLQSLQQMSSTFAGIVTAFCNSLNWTMLALIVSQFKERLYFGIHRDLIDLMRISDLNTQRARAIFDAGITTLVDLANADVLQVEKILYNCISFDSAKKGEGEDDEEANKRNNMRNLYVTGKTGITVKDAAKLLISDARRFLEYEMGVKNINWDQTQSKENSQSQSMQHVNKTAENLNTSRSQQRSLESSKNDNSVTKILKLNNTENIETITSIETNKKTETIVCDIFDIKNNKNVSKENIFKAKKENQAVPLKQLEIVKKTFSKNCEDTKEMETPGDKNTTKKKTKVYKEGIRRSPRNISSGNTILKDSGKEIKKLDLQARHELRDSSACKTGTIVDGSFALNTQLLKASDCNDLKRSTSKRSSPILITEDSLEEIKTSPKIPTIQNSRILRSNRSKISEVSANINSKPTSDGTVSTKGEESSIEISNLSAGSSLLRHPIHLNSSLVLNASKIECSSASFECLLIIDVCGNSKLFSESVKEIKKAKSLSLSVAVEKLQEQRKPKIGAHLLINQQNLNSSPDYDFMFDECYYLAGVALTLENENVVLYMDMQSKRGIPDISSDLRIETLESILIDKDKVLKIFDAKEHFKVLKKAIPALSDINASIEDPKVAAWLLQPDVDITFTQLAQQYAPECCALVDLVNRGPKPYSIGLSSNSSIRGKIRSSVESCVTLHILKGQLENLERIGDGQLKKFFHDLEMPLQILLFRMESYGFPSNERALGELSQRIFDAMKKIEKKIYELHGSRFNLSSSSAVARVLGLHKKANGRYCTSKQILEKIDTPISDLILNYRKLSVVLSKNVQPLLKCVVNNRIHGNSITFTSTGRISMHEPNLQNVAKDFEITVPGTEKILISCRAPFYPEEGKSLISADFCQLEMRILTHLSQDPLLLKVIKSEKDIFTAIAAKWNNISENEVSEALRNGTKQICYGIIYGMGMKSLADALMCSEQEAMTVSEQFHLAYPGIRIYTQKVIRYAQQKGYVETITGRRRYLEHINSSEVQLRSQAERQAVNTTIQGSAADITKSAILRMEKNLIKYSKQLRINSQNDRQTEVKLVLHLHDELIFEVPEDRAYRIAKALKMTMENCVKLNVPLQVKLKAGKSWGMLQEIRL